MQEDRIIEWDDDGYPTEESLERLRQAINDDDTKKAIKAFYAALKENHWPDWCGPEQIEKHGELMDVWGYHTGGWSGNESIIEVLQDSIWFHLFLQRYDRGGHYYFDPPSRWLREGDS